jgi:hypothetical protein
VTDCPACPHVASPVHGYPVYRENSCGVQRRQPDDMHKLPKARCVEVEHRAREVDCGVVVKQTPRYGTEQCLGDRQLATRRRAMNEDQRHAWRYDVAITSATRRSVPKPSSSAFALIKKFAQAKLRDCISTKLVNHRTVYLFWPT